MAGELAVLADAVRADGRAMTDRFDERAIWRLRSDLMALDAYLRTNPKAASASVRRALDRGLELAGTAHAFASELRGFQAQKEHSERASVFDLGSVGILAVENVLTAERPSLPRVVMSALSEALMYLASRQYVGGSNEVLLGLYRQHAAAMYRELWALATDHRKGMTPTDVRAIQESIDGFFARLEADGMPIEARVAILNQFYALLLTLRVAELLDAIGG